MKDNEAALDEIMRNAEEEKNNADQRLQDRLAARRIA